MSILSTTPIIQPIIEKGIIPLQETATSRAAFWSHIPLGLSAEGAAGKQHNEKIKKDLKIKFRFLEINREDKLKKTHKFPIIPYSFWVLGYREQSLAGHVGS